MRAWTWLAAVFLVWGGNAAADTFELTFNDQSAQVGYWRAMAEDEFGRSLANGRILFNDHEETLLGSVGLDFAGAPGNVPGLELALGAQLMGGRTDHSRDLLAVGVGGRLDYQPPVLGGAYIGGKVFYAPKVFSFLETERMLETGVRLGYAVTPRARVLVEYQTVRADVEDGGNWTIDEGARVGFEARF